MESRGTSRSTGGNDRQGTTMSTGGSHLKCCVCSRGFRSDSKGQQRHYPGYRGTGRKDFSGSKDDNKSYLPRILPCCHNACDYCLQTAITLNRSILCKICNVESWPSPSTDFDIEFPLNSYVLGLLHSGKNDFYDEDDEQVTFDQKTARREALVVKTRGAVKICTECRGLGTEICDSCRAVFCHPCFDTVHSKAKFLMGHKSSKLSSDSSAKMKRSMCSRHSQFKLEFFCKLCNVSICTECLINEHNGHKLQNISEKNMEYLDEVVEAYTSVSNVQRSVKLSIQKAKKAMMATAKGSNAADSRADFRRRIKDHFLQLHTYLVRMEAELMATVNSSSRTSSLTVANDKLAVISEQIEESLQEAKVQIENGAGSDLHGLLKELRALENLPCVLVSETNDRGANSLLIDEGIFSTLDDHVTLLLSDPCTYVVRSADEAPEAAAEVKKLTTEEARAELQVGRSPFKPRKASDNFHGSSTEEMRSNSSSSSSIVESTSFLTPPETLIVGVSFTVEVTHFTSPDEFYVLRSGTENRLADISTELANHAYFFSNMARPKKKDFRPLKKGDMCMVKYEKDETWCRCEILSVEDGNTFKLLYIDYGTIQKVPKRRAYPLPKTMMDYPPVAIRCGLARIKPANGDEWDWEVNREVSKMLSGERGHKAIVVLHKDVTSHVRLVREHPVCPIDVGLALVYLGYAVLDGVVYPKLEEPRLKLNFRKFKPLPELSGDELEDTNVMLLHIESPHKFYIRIQSRVFADFYSQLQSDCKLLERRMDGGNPTKVYFPAAGMGVAAFSESRWERAKIIEPLPERMLKVFLVDIGRCELIQWDKALILDESFFKLPPQAYKCSLLHIAPVGSEWCSEAADVLRQFQSTRLNVKQAIWDPKTSCAKIQLMGIGISTDTCVNALLVQKGFATGTGSSANTVEYPKMPKIPTSKECQILMDNQNKEEKSLTKLRPAESLIDDRKLLDDTVKRVDGMHRIRVKILKVVNPGEFYVTFDCHDELYTDLYKRLELFSKKGGVLSKPETLWKPNDRCLVKDGTTWKRGFVWEEPLIDEHQRMIVKVRLVDEFKEVSVPANSVFGLPEEFYEPGDRVIPCRLGGILPAPGASWSQSSIQELNDFVNTYNVKLYICKMKKLPADDKFAPVELFSYVKVDRSRFLDLGPSKKKPSETWCNFNHALRMRGMAKADQYTVWDSNGKRKYATEIYDPDVEAAPYRNLMEDEVELFTALLKERFHETKEGGVDMTRPRQLEDFERAKWFPAEPLASLSLVGKVTFVGDNCEVYMQDYLSGTPTLTMINEEASKLCTGTEPEEIDWAVGDICLARFWTDKSWYRGEIMKLNIEGYYTVKFVDYGNQEYVQPTDLRRARGLTMRPIQAHVCYFDNLAPVTQKWEKPQLQDIHSILVDKLTRVTLRKLSSGHYGIVSMNLPDNADALKEIVSRRLGRYLNLSRPHGLESKTSSNVVPADCSNEAELESVEDVESEDGSVTPAVSAVKFQETTPVFWWKWYKEKPEARARSYEIIQLPADINTVSVDIVSILTPDLFLVHLYGRENDEMERNAENFLDLQGRLQEEAEHQKCISPPYQLKECCSMFEDGIWYRAVVMKESWKEGRKTVIVQYVDYGNMEEKFIQDVRELKEDWFQVPAQAIPCRLFGYKYSWMFPLSEAKGILSRVFEAEPSASAFVKKREVDTLSVELRNESGELVFRELIENGFYQTNEEED